MSDIKRGTWSYGVICKRCGFNIRLADTPDGPMGEPIRFPDIRYSFRCGNAACLHEDTYASTDIGRYRPAEAQ